MGLNGSMMDPMRMSDAELLEPPSAPTATVPAMGEKTSDEVKTNNSAEFKAMEEKVKSVEIDKERMVAEIEKQKSEILSLRDTATKLTRENSDLNEDELTDLREQFGLMEKEADQNTQKQKELETEKAKLQESLNAHTKETENLKASQ